MIHPGLRAPFFTHTEAAAVVPSLRRSQQQLGVVRNCSAPRGCVALRFRRPTGVCWSVPCSADRRPGLRRPTCERSAPISALISISGDQRGESALVHLPNPNAEREEVLIEAQGLTHVDAFTAAALRGAVEYYGRRCQKTVTFGPPANTTVWRLLSSLMGTDLSHHFCLARGAAPPTQARAAVLPTQRIDSLDVTDLIANGLPELIGDNYGRRNARLLASAFGTLVENSLMHASTSPIGTLATINFEKDANTLQLVVADLGPGLGGAKDAEGALINLVEQSQKSGGGLTGLVEDSQRKEIDMELRIASAGGRLEWRDGTPEISGAQFLHGFTSAAIIQLEP